MYDICEQARKYAERPRPINGMSVETFVHGYDGQSQMNVNTIAGRELTGRGNKRIGEIYQYVTGKSPFYTEL